MMAVEHPPPLHPLSVIPLFYPSILPPIHLSFTSTPSTPPFLLILHPQHTAQTPGEIMSVCQPLCSDRLEQSFLFFIPPAHVKADMIGTHLKFWLLLLCAGFVGESLLRFWYRGKAPLTARMMKVQRAFSASLSVNAGILLSPKCLLLGNGLYCWVIMEDSVATSKPKKNLTNGLCSPWSAKQTEHLF